MTRQEIVAEFKVDAHGVIGAPGKFEGEMLYAPYFSDIASYGEELEYGSGRYTSLVAIDAVDRVEFPELGHALYVVVEETDQGFVSCSLLFAEHEAQTLRNDLDGYGAETED